MSKFQWNTKEAMVLLPEPSVFGRKQTTKPSNAMLGFVSDRIEVGYGE